MDELSHLTYKNEVDALRDEPNFEALGDAKYLYHQDVNARLYWAFCRPSGSCQAQLCDEDVLVSIMAFNHSRLDALKRFELLHPSVMPDVGLRQKIRNRSRMLFRALADDDFTMLNCVLNIVPQFLDLAVDQVKNGRTFNDISIDLIQATLFLQKAHEHIDEALYEALYKKLEPVEDKSLEALSAYIDKLFTIHEEVDAKLLKKVQQMVHKSIEARPLHALQKKVLLYRISQLGSTV